MTVTRLARAARSTLQPGISGLKAGVSTETSSIVQHGEGSSKDAWEQSEEVLQGGIERAQRSTPLGTTPDILMMSASLAELQFLQCKWHDASATASAIDIADPGLFSSQDASVASTSAFNERPALQTAQGILVSVDALSRLASGQEIGTDAEALEGEGVPASAAHHTTHLRALANPMLDAHIDVELCQKENGTGALAQLRRAHCILALLTRGQMDAAQSLLGRGVHAEHTEETSTSGTDKAKCWQAVADLEMAGAQAQVALQSKDWDIAEEAATYAVSVCDDQLTGRDTSTALALSLAATAYVRRGRLMFAEGLLRKATEHMRLSADSASTERSDGAKHTALPSRSAKASVAWQMGQLYAVMEKRETESHKWLRIGKQLWPFGEQHSLSIATQLGGERVFAGEARSPHPAVTSLALQRLFASKI